MEVDLHNSITLGLNLQLFIILNIMSDFSFEGESHNFWEFVCGQTKAKLM